MFKLLVAALLVGIISGAPVISLSLDESSLTKNTVYKGQYGVGCNKNAALCRKQQGESQYVHACPAAASSVESCPIPQAKAYDHHDGDLSDKVTYKVFLVNADGKSRVDSPAVCSNRNCINYKNRGEWVTKFDVQDNSGNAAETVLFAMVLDDMQAPVITPKGPYRSEANKNGGSAQLPVATAFDNIDHFVPVRVLPKSVSLKKLAVYEARWISCDKAGMFGPAGHDNCIAKGFKYTVSDTTKPVIITTSTHKTIECKKNARADPHLRSLFNPTCVDNFDGKIACKTDQDIHHPLNKGSTVFHWVATDHSGNTATKASRVTVVDTKKPILRISDAGHKHLKRDETGNYQLVYKGAKVEFSRTILRDMGYDWANNGLLTHRMGDKVEFEMVKELMTPGQGYTCTDDCAGATARTSVHMDLQSSETPVPCDAATAANEVNYNHKRKGSFTLKYTCTDEVGHSVTQCRTVRNVPIGKVAINVYVEVPTRIQTADIKAAIVGFFAKPINKQFGVEESDIQAQQGKVISSKSRRLIAAATGDRRQDLVQLNASPRKLANVYKALISCEFEAHLAKELALKCAKLPEATKDPTFKCVEVKEVDIATVNQATPLIIVKGKKELAVEALSKYTDAGAYCIKPCDEHDDIMKCPGRLPMGKTVMKVTPSPSCSQDGLSGPKVGSGESSEFHKVGDVDTGVLAEYLIEYDCSYTVDGHTYEALTKMRAVKVLDTTKPVCTIVGPKVIKREASFPYSPDAAVCQDNFDGKLKTISTGSVDVKTTGKYVLTYAASDKSGNAAAKVFKTVMVVDTLKPVIMLKFGDKLVHRSAAKDHGANGQQNPLKHL